MPGQPKLRAKKQAREAAEIGLDPVELLSKLTDRDLELLAGAWLTKRGIDPRSLTPSRQSVSLPQFDLPWMSVFLLALRDTGNVRSAATAAGVSRQLVYQHRESNELFRGWWDTCLADAVDLLEMSAWALASRLDGPMIRFLLMSHRPEQYGVSAKVTHRGDKENPVEVNHTHKVGIYLPHNGRDEITSDVVDPPSGVRMLTEQEQLDMKNPGSSAIEADWEPQEEDSEDE